MQKCVGEDGDQQIEEKQLGKDEVHHVEDEHDRVSALVRAARLLVVPVQSHFVGAPFLIVLRG